MTKEPNKKSYLPVSPSEIFLVNDVAKVVSMSVQSLLGAVNDKFLTGANFKIEQGVPFKLQNVIHGLPSNFAATSFSMVPSLLFREKLEERKVNPFAMSSVLSFLETALSTPLEVRGAEKMLKNMGNDISQSRAKISARVFAPFFVRNCLFWLGINLNDRTKETPAEQVFYSGMYGGAAGFMATAPAIMGNFMLSHNKNLSFSQSFMMAFNQTKNLSWENFAKSCCARSSSGMISAVVFSTLVSEKLVEIIDPLMREAHKSFSNNSEQNTDRLPQELPGAVITKPSSEKLDETQKSNRR